MLKNSNKTETDLKTEIDLILYIYKEWISDKLRICQIVNDRNPIFYFWPNRNWNWNAVTETESKRKVNGKY